MPGDVRDSADSVEGPHRHTEFAFTDLERRCFFEPINETLAFRNTIA